MPIKVVLQFSKGGLKDKKFSYEQNECVIIGRNNDCSIVIPEIDNTVSRYHCLLDIAPPTVTVRDFGSLNGSYLNSEKIGQRDASQSVEEARKQRYNEFPMKSGDHLGLGKDCEIILTVALPLYCAECFCEISHPEFMNSHNQPICPDCHAKIEARKNKDKIIQKVEEDKIAVEKAKRNNPRCEICGAPIYEVVGESNICQNCRNNPVKALEYLMMNAKKEADDAQQIAGYRNIRILGKGGMGAVWLVEEEKTGKQMALKLMLPDAASDEKGKQMFLREAYIAGQLKHQNIVRHYKTGNSEDTYFILMEFCQGGSVTDLMTKNGGKLSIETATHIILQTLEGLHYAHHAPIDVTLADGSKCLVNGVVHRDFKPGNIFLSDHSSHPIAKVADFGLAKAFQTAGLSKHTLTGTVAGTPVFMPRQQIINYRYAKPDVDVWAAAASYYCMLTGFPPKDFAGKDAVNVALTTDAIPIRERNAQIPKRLAEVIDTALRERPAIGIQSALELKKEIEKAL